MLSLLSSLLQRQSSKHGTIPMSRQVSVMRKYNLDRKFQNEPLLTDNGNQLSTNLRKKSFSYHSYTLPTGPSDWQSRRWQNDGKRHRRHGGVGLGHFPTRTWAPANVKVRGGGGKDQLLVWQPKYDPACWDQIQGFSFLPILQEESIVIHEFLILRKIKRATIFLQVGDGLLIIFFCMLQLLKKKNKPFFYSNIQIMLKQKKRSELLFWMILNYFEVVFHHRSCHFAHSFPSAHSPFRTKVSLQPSFYFLSQLFLAALPPLNHWFND